MKAGGCKKEFNVSLLKAIAQCMQGSMALNLLSWHHLAHRIYSAYDEPVRAEQYHLCMAGLEQMCGCKAGRWAQLYRRVQRSHRQPAAMHGGAQRLLPGTPHPNMLPTNSMSCSAEAHALPEVMTLFGRPQNPNLQ